jgi:hypothetical protein
MGKLRNIKYLGKKFFDLNFFFGKFSMKSFLEFFWIMGHYVSKFYNFEGWDRVAFAYN